MTIRPLIVRDMHMAQTMECPRCDGNGMIPRYSMVHHGTCFKCRGTGVVNIPKPIRKGVVSKKTEITGDIPSEYYGDGVTYLF